MINIIIGIILMGHGIAMISLGVWFIEMIIRKIKEDGC